MGGAGPIPCMAIDRWAERHGVEPGDDYARFETLMIRMDNVALAHWEEERKRSDRKRGKR